MSSVGYRLQVSQVTPSQHTGPVRWHAGKELTTVVTSLMRVTRERDLLIPFPAPSQPTPLRYFVQYGSGRGNWHARFASNKCEIKEPTVVPFGTTKEPTVVPFGTTKEPTVVPFGTTKEPTTTVDFLVQHSSETHAKGPPFASVLPSGEWQGSFAQFPKICLLDWHARGEQWTVTVGGCFVHLINNYIS